MKKFLLCCVLVVSASSIPGQADTYVGDFCWVMAHPDGNNRYFKLGLSVVGGGHMYVNGIWKNSDATKVSPINGSAEVIDGKWEFSLQRMDSNLTETKFRAIHFDLGAGLNGMARWIRINRDASVASNEAPVTYASCTVVP